MSTKIYNAFEIKTNKAYSLQTIVELANNTRQKMIPVFIKEYSKIILKRMYHAIDLLAYYGDGILEMDKFRDSRIIKDIEDWIDIKKRHSEKTEIEQLRYFWMHSVISLEKDLDELEHNYKTVHHKANIVFIPCGRKTLAMYFGDPTYVHILFEDEENFADYHYQNQTDRPDNISAKEWNKRKRDWDKAIGPDYIPAKHGLEFSLIDYTDANLSMSTIKNFENTIKEIDSITNHRLNNILDTLECPLIDDKITDDMTETDKNIFILKQARTNEYKKWKEETKKLVREKLKI